MSEELKPCQHGRNFCMECHYDSKSPQQRLDDANATIAELRAEVERIRQAWQPMGELMKQNSDLRAELDALRGQEAVVIAHRLRNILGEVVTEWQDGTPPERITSACGVVQADIVVELAYAAPIAKEQGEWIACAERLPEVVRSSDGSVNEVLGLWKENCIPECGGQYIVVNTVYFNRNASDFIAWRPLPAAPSRQGEGGGGEWWIDSHGVTMMALDSLEVVFKTLCVPETAVRHPETGNLSNWRNDWGASYIATANPANILALLDDFDAMRQRVELLERLLSTARDYVYSELVERKAAMAGYPHKWQQEEADLAEIDAALAQEAKP